MSRFFEELNELKMQQGELPDQRGRKSKRHVISPSAARDSQNEMPIDSMNTLDPSGVPHPNQTDMLSPLPVNQAPHVGNAPSLPVNHSVVASAGFEPEPTTQKKGGRPKLPLFSVRPSRQKARISKVMEFIRSFALKNRENVDDILWTLLILRVKGSGNVDISNELAKLYKHWNVYVSNACFDSGRSNQISNLMSMMPPIQQNLPVSNNQTIDVDIGGNDQLYPMRIAIDNAILVPTDQSEITV